MAPASSLCSPCTPTPTPGHPRKRSARLPSRKKTRGGTGKSAPAGHWALVHRASRGNGGDTAVTPASPHPSPLRTQPRRREQLLAPLSQFILGVTYWPPQPAESPGLPVRLPDKAQKGPKSRRWGRARCKRRRGGSRLWPSALARPLRVSKPDPLCLDPLRPAGRGGRPPPPQTDLALPGRRDGLLPDPVTGRHLRPCPLESSPPWILPTPSCRLPQVRGSLDPAPGNARHE